MVNDHQQHIITLRNRSIASIRMRRRGVGCQPAPGIEFDTTLLTGKCNFRIPADRLFQSLLPEFPSK
jgi:hypothetical protein